MRFISKDELPRLLPRLRDRHESLVIYTPTREHISTIIEFIKELGFASFFGVTTSRKIREWWSEYGEKTCYRFSCGGAGYCSLGWYESHGYTVYDIVDILQSAAVPPPNLDDLF